MLAARLVVAQKRPHGDCSTTGRIERFLATQPLEGWRADTAGAPGPEKEPGKRTAAEGKHAAAAGCSSFPAVPPQVRREACSRGRRSVRSLEWSQDGRTVSGPGSELDSGQACRAARAMLALKRSQERHAGPEGRRAATSDVLKWKKDKLARKRASTSGGLGPAMEPGQARSP